MACFSCGENKSDGEKSILQKYKENHERTGNSYWFYKEKNTNEIYITTDEDFKLFRKQNKEAFKKGLYEFSHISEFRDA
jgi:hypothetical protein